ncbi:MAG: efflux RND transporter periplasmic adaptor subunit [Desulfobacteraceae bacterium]|nr:efflux RND transporter periplasmic adaptor subunit [Desulfobacteraceae bacterium]
MDNPPPIPRRSAKSKLVRTLLVIVILAAAAVGARHISATRPKARQQPPRAAAALVEVTVVQPASEQIVLQAMGTVVPAREITLAAQVSGEVVQVHPEFVEGGFLAEGSEVLRIDPLDYQLAVTRLQGEVARARYELDLELGRQDVARREWDLLNAGKPTAPGEADLALRKPHLAKARAELAAAEANLRQAEINLARTTLRAPFNALVRTRHVERGSQVSPQTALATLVGTDTFWVQTAVAVDRLQWFALPAQPGEPGARAVVRHGREGVAGRTREGRVVRLLGDLEPDGRMARVLVAVPDPLDRSRPAGDRLPLLIGDYVRVEIQGHSIDGVYRIPRSALRDNTRVWVVTDQNLLSIRTAVVAWRDAETVLVQSGLEPGERLIVSDLPAPVEGMALRIKGDTPEETAPARPQEPAG